MRILAFDTSTDRCSVALSDGADGWLIRDVLAGHAHSTLLLPMIRAVLGEAHWRLHDLDGIAFGAGPGSFTGVRIACGVAQGLSFGASHPVLGVSTLEAMAYEAGEPRVITCLDARMREVYFAAFTVERGALCATIAPQVSAPAAVPCPDGEAWHGAGNGFAEYPELIARLAPCLTGYSAVVYPTAKAIGALALSRFRAGCGLPAAAAAPIYVRERVALTTVERTSGARL